MNVINRLIGIAFTIIFITACSDINIMPEKRVEYKKSRQSQTSLEIPPDLTAETIEHGGVSAGASPDVTSWSEYQQGKRDNATSREASVLPTISGVNILRSGDKRWLRIKGPAQSVWNKTIAFWQENGIVLIEQDPSAGYMKTDWIENRANIKSDFLTDFLRKTLDSLYSSGTRDQFTIRLERAGDHTELYVTHDAMEEKILTGPGGSDVDRAVWAHAGRDPEIEAIMLNKLVAFMGFAERKEKIVAKSAKTLSGGMTSLTTGALSKLEINTDFARAWQIIGRALNRGGFAIADLNRNEGIYYVRYKDAHREPEKKGFFSKMAFWRSDEDKDIENYQVRVQGSSPAIVSVLNAEGQAVKKGTDSRILSVLNTHIR